MPAGREKSSKVPARNADGQILIINIEQEIESERHQIRDSFASRVLLGHAAKASTEKSHDAIFGMDPQVSDRMGLQAKKELIASQFSDNYHTKSL